MSEHYCNYKDGMCELDVDEAYQQGRADKYQEIVSEYMLLTEEQVNQIRADAIEEYKGKMLSRLIPHLNNLECAKDSETYLAITEIAEQLKGAENE